MLRSSRAALFASASVIALCWATDGNARGGGHFGGGGRGGEHFDRRPEMRERRPEEHRGEGEHRHEENAARHHEGDHDAHRAEEHHENADHRGDDHRDLANHDSNHPINQANWNHNQFWNNQFGARNWNCAGCHWGWAGAVFWPFALGDVFSYAWWPNTGAPAFWNYGVNTMLTGLFWPNGVYQWPEGYGAYANAGNGNSYKYARETHQDVYSAGPAEEAQEKGEAATTSDAELAQSCTGFAPGVDGLPMNKIESTLKPEGHQRAAFDDLKAASTKADAILKGACPSEAPLTPVGRLDVLQKRLTAMIGAVDTVKAPLATFSGVLTDQQRRELDAMGGSKGANASGKEMGDVSACIDQGQQFADVPAQQIEQAVQPDAQQTAALDQLKSVSAKAAERLRSQCPTSVPDTAEARLQSMDKRLHDTMVAVNEVRPALVGFYESLSDEQKARFNTLPPEQAAQRP
jgi:LTXXQ motif family protein